MTLDDRLGDLLTDAAASPDQAPPTRAGVDRALRRRATRRRRATIAGAAAALVVPVVGALALVGGNDEPQSATDERTATHLPLVGIDLVGYTLRPELDPVPTPGDEDLTYASFTAEEPDVLGPMITASAHPGDVDPCCAPVDLDLDGADRGAGDGWMSTFPDGATVSWSIDGAIASLNGHGVPPEDVLAYAQQLNGEPFDLATMPAPERLPHREVVTFEPVPDFPSRVASYEGPPGAVHVLVTDDRGYYDLTRIVSTEGEPYEQVPLGRSFLGTGTAILSPDDDGATSALLRVGGLIVHVFGPNLDADTLRTAIEHGRLTDLSVDPSPTTTTYVEPADTSITDIRVGAHENADRIVIEFAEAVPENHSVDASNVPSAGECVLPALTGTAFLNIHLGLTEYGRTEPVPGTADGPVAQVVPACEFEAFVDLVVQIDTDRQAGDPWNEVSVTTLEDPARLVVDVPR